MVPFEMPGNGSKSSPALVSDEASKFERSDSSVRVVQDAQAIMENVLS